MSRSFGRTSKPNRLVPSSKHGYGSYRIQVSVRAGVDLLFVMLKLDQKRRYSGESPETEASEEHLR